VFQAQAAWRTADNRLVRRLAVPTCLLACAAALLAAPAASAKLRLPRGAAAPPQLSPGLVPAELPPVSAAAGQRATAASALTVAASHADGSERRPYWATVNICDTSLSPNGLGVRTSVPGNGNDERVYARFTAQWWSGRRQQWLTVGGAGTSDWVYVGSSRFTAQQAGWTFHFSDPPSGTTFVMRGVVELTWRRRADRRTAPWQVVRERTLLTRTGMPDVDGGDPAGTSKAMCLIW
jgi:hypothetical protein